MNYVFVVIIALGCLSAQAQQPAGPAGPWDLVFEDNFDGTALNTQKWNYNYTWGHTHNHRAYMIDSMVTVKNGQMQIKAIHQRHPDAPDGTNQWASQFGYIPFDYTSGAINSNSKFNFTYGYLEGSFKASSALGTWPAFWALNANGAWPPEIDVLEIPAARNQHHYYYHYKNASGAEASFGTTHTGPDKSAGFHTYGVEWGPTYMKFYFDGQLLNSYTNHTECNQGLNMYIIINLAVGGWAGDPPAGAVFPAYYFSDWVRVWKRNPTMNLDFETGTLSPWGAWNNAAITQDCKRSGTYGIKNTGSPASIEQTVELLPNATYVFGGYAKVNTAGEHVLFGVKDYGGNQITKTITSTSFVRDSVVFTTGSTNTTATLFWYKDAGSGSACGDDFFLYQPKDCNGIAGGPGVYDACQVCIKSGWGMCKDLTNGNYTIQPVHSSLCLQAGGTSVAQQTCNTNAASQAWKVTKVGMYYQIQNVSNNQFLSYATAASGTAVSLSATAAGKNWRLEDAGGGSFYLVPATNFELNWDVNGNNSNTGQVVLLYGRNGQNNQKFLFSPSTFITTGLNNALPVDASACYPNPFTDQLTIQLAGPFDYTVLNQSGAVLAQGKAEDQVFLGTGLDAGVYVIKIQTTEGVVYVKAVKQ